MRKLFGVALIVFVIVVTWLAVYGAVQIYTHASRHELAEAQKDQIVMLELKVEDYERTAPVLPVLRQIFTEEAWMELEALAEQTKQRKRREP